MNLSNGSKEKERDYARNVFTRILNRIRSFFGFMKASYKTLFLVAIVAIISVASTTWVSIFLGESDSEINLPSLGTIKTIEVEPYCDANSKNKRETLSWDEITIEKLEWDEIRTELVSTTVFVKSVSNLKITLSIFLTNWDPVEISDYITISWNYNGT